MRCPDDRNDCAKRANRLTCETKTRRWNSGGTGLRPRPEDPLRRQLGQDRRFRAEIAALRWHRATCAALCQHARRVENEILGCPFAHLRFECHHMDEHVRGCGCRIPEVSGASQRCIVVLLSSGCLLEIQAHFVCLVRWHCFCLVGRRPLRSREFTGRRCSISRTPRARVNIHL